MRTLVACLFGLLVGVVLAAPAAVGGAAETALRKKASEVFGQLDGNGDGTVTIDEIQSFAGMGVDEICDGLKLTSKGAKALTNYDANSDNILDIEELGKLFDKIDDDKNSIVGADEFAAHMIAAFTA
ncbi:uncharacterized protein [Littorina saxatilis]